MKVGILLTTFNRPEYLKQTLWSLERVKPLKETIIIINDDNSADPTALRLQSEFKHPKAKVILAGHHTNVGIKQNLIDGYSALFYDNKCDLVINFDSDAIIRPDAITRLIEMYKAGLDGTILTGFHSTTKNANGTDRHKITAENEYYYHKQSVGGINMCIDKQAYEKFVKPALLSHGNWDHNSCINAGGAYCLKESVVQHIGFDSSLNHTEAPDIADDFYYWHLPNVTLLGVDNQPERLNKAKDICTKWIKFGNVITLNPDIRSKEAYSEFMIREAYKYVDTSHCLIFQHDGFVNNWQAWDDSWLQYDYIGAPWHYSDGMAVGNGGFSLRSKKLMELCSKIIKHPHPEDHHICRTYRKQLEAEGMKFAPVEVAEKFAFEGYLQPDKVLSDQFGVHGSNPRKAIQAPIQPQKYVVGQFASLGDIIWLVPLIRALQAEGNTCLWPVNPEYLNLKKHFPDINFQNKNAITINYENRMRSPTPYGHWLPYRFASENMGRSLRQCMESKYEMYGHSWKIFRQLHWIRDHRAEQDLFDALTNGKPYILVNRYFGAQAQMQITPEIKSKLPIVEMKAIGEYTLFDWALIIENAVEIHTANTSLLYILEQMDLKMPIHLYHRNGLWGEVGFSFTEFLHSKPYIKH